jgi:5-formyltetrahydrofolate cyclo-ligase
MIDKAQLRKECRVIRNAIKNKGTLSEVICGKIEAWEIFQHASVIAIYLPIKGEVDLTPLAERHGKKWIIPRIIPEEDHRMVFHPYDRSRLIRHSFGMLEPDPTLDQIPANAIDLVLAPGLAFDQSGWRLGYGGGYFDRFLKTFAGVTAGITYQALLLDEVPHTEFDVAMGWVVTEEGEWKVENEK